MNPALVELITRAQTQIALGKQTGTRTSNPHNIYQIAQELVDALAAALAPAQKEDV